MAGKCYYLNMTEILSPYSDLWRSDVTRSQRAGSSAILGVYGKAIQQDADLISRALANGLTDVEIAELDALRPIGEAERFGKDGKFGWVDPQI